MAAGGLWSREEILAAFVLYLRLPKSQISNEKNPDIVRLANAVGRTPNSIAIRLQNIPACDPNATRKGFTKGGKAIERLWPEYAERGDEMLEETIGAYNAILAASQPQEREAPAVRKGVPEAHRPSLEFIWYHNENLFLDRSA